MSNPRASDDAYGHGLDVLGANFVASVSPTGVRAEVNDISPWKALLACGIFGVSVGIGIAAFRVYHR